LNVVGKLHAAQLNRTALHIGISGCGHEPRDKAAIPNAFDPIRSRA
jgi:hypothetical protein